MPIFTSAIGVTDTSDSVSTSVVIAGTDAGSFTGNKSTITEDLKLPDGYKNQVYGPVEIANNITLTIKNKALLVIEDLDLLEDDEYNA